MVVCEAIIHTLSKSQAFISTPAVVKSPDLPKFWEQQKKWRMLVRTNTHTIFPAVFRSIRGQRTGASTNKNATIFQRRLNMKKAYVILILVIVTIVHVLAIRNCRHKREIVEYRLPSNVAIEERLDKQVSALKLLSVTETVRQLDRMEHYTYSGAFIGAGTILFHDTYGNMTPDSLHKQNKIELEKILSSRVFRKSLQDLSQLPKDQASKLLASELDDALSKHFELYKGFFELRSLDFTVGESADGKPVFLGFRNKVFAIILIAGSLELTDIHGKIKEIDAIAKNQKLEVRRIEEEHIRVNYALDALLHNNAVLASGLYGTSPRKGDSELKSFADRFTEHKLVDFSARGTEFDVMVWHGVQELVPDKEHINVRYFDQMTNEDLDELRRIFDSP